MRPDRRPPPRGKSSLAFRTRAAAVIPASALCIAAWPIGACAPLAARDEAGIVLTGNPAASQLETLGASVADEIITNPRVVAFRNHFAAQHGKDTPLVASLISIDVIGGWRDDQANARKAYDAFAAQLMDNGFELAAEPDTESPTKDPAADPNSDEGARATLGIHIRFSRHELPGKTAFEFQAKLVDPATKSAIAVGHSMVDLPRPNAAH